MNWLKSVGTKRFILIYLDTHIVVWLYAGLVKKFSQSIKRLMNENELYLSPMVLCWLLSPSAQLASKKSDHIEFFIDAAAFYFQRIFRAALQNYLHLRHFSTAQESE